MHPDAHLNDPQPLPQKAITHERDTGLPSRTDALETVAIVPPVRDTVRDIPKPDYVLIEAHEDGPRLVFGEHDRGSEPIDRFISRKVLLYAALASFPEACAHGFGLSTFTVRVSVTDPVHRAPMRRLTSLITATRHAGGSEVADLFRFTLAGWLHAYPAEPIWFAPNDDPTHESVRWQEHGGRYLQHRR
jgi:hypothetical protein